MYRLCRVLRRTSRRSHGGWAPTANIVAPDQVPVQSFTPPQQHNTTSTRNASNSRCYDDADNANVHLDEVTYPYFRNWKADPALRPSGASQGKTSDRGNNTSSTRKSFVFDTNSARQKLGLGSMEPQPAAGQPRTLTSRLRRFVEDTFEPLSADSLRMGGDGREDRVLRQRELKYADQRMRFISSPSPLTAHTVESVLRGIEQIEGPSGALYDNELLRGRIVGFLFFTDTPRSREFMATLQKFHARHTPDFVVVAVSAFEKEMAHLTRGFGFYHCHARYGGTILLHGTNATLPPFIPMPRLIVVDGSSGEILSRGGVTAVSLHPDTCFAEWRANEPGYCWTDLLRMCFRACTYEMGSGFSGARHGASSSSSAQKETPMVLQGTDPAWGLSLVHYEHGQPDVDADEVYGCFAMADLRGEMIGAPGMLYRLVNSERNEWYFYNDTKEFNMVVTGYFGALSTVRPLGKTKMYREMPSGLLVLELIVPPLTTQAYLEGEPHDGFDLHFKALPIYE